jgi:hypothetical protein
MKNRLTIEQLERRFELDTDALDSLLLKGNLTQEEYDLRSREMALEFEERGSQIRSNAWGES